MTRDKLIILIDGHSLAYRSYFALERTGMRNRNKFPTWAVYGFLKAFFDLISKTQPDGMAVSFDVSRRTFRTERFSEYKANRPPMPDDMRQQITVIRRAIETLNIPVFEKEGFEADDIIGTLATKITQEGHQVKILTGDQDSFQLLDNDKVSVLLPIKGILEEFNRDKVHNKLGVYPEQIIDYKGLCGDSSDNIPGIKGIGQKSAVTLLSQYKTIDEVYNNLDKVTKAKLKTLLEEGKDMAYLSRELATIKRDVELDYNFKCCSLEMPHLEDFVELLKEMEFRTFIIQIPKLFKNFIDYNNYEVTVKGDHVIVKQREMALALTYGDQETATTESSSAPQTLQQEFLKVDDKGQTKLAFVIGGDTQNPISESLIIDQKDDLISLVEQLKKSPVISLDLETDSLNYLEAKIVGISFSWLKKHSIKVKNGKLLQSSEDFECQSAYIPAGHKNGDQIELNTILSTLKPLLEDNTIPKILHNAKYDMHVLKNYDIDLNNVIYDTILASYIDDPAERHGLKDLVMRIFQYPMDDYSSLSGTGKKKVTLDEVDIKSVANYANLDSAMTLKLAHYYSGLLDQTQNKLLYDLEIPLIKILFKMERRGISLDSTYLKDLSKELTKSIKELETKIYAEAKYPQGFNINSPKQLGEVLFVHMGLPTQGKTKSKSGYSTSAEVLEKLSADFEIARLLLEYRHLVKLQNTYIDALPKLINKKTHKIHTSFNQTATTTGRLSSSDPNLQNIPIRTEIGNRIRKAFITSDPATKLLISADYSQIELRVLADICDEPNLKTAFINGKDIHTETAAKVFGIETSEVTKDMRRIAKAVNFGIVYGQTAYGLSETLGITPKEAKEFIAKYFANYPKVKEYMSDIVVQAHAKGYVSTKLGRKRYLMDGLGNRNKNIKEFAERAAINAPIQGSAADLIKMAMIKLDAELKQQNLQAQLLLQVHDELVLEVAESELEILKSVIKDSMENVCKLSVPLVVDINTGQNWMEAK